MGSRVLVVDSDFGVRVRVVAALVDAGYEVSVAGDSWDAMGVAARERPDLILLGDSMARVGLSLVGRLITTESTADVPILVVADGAAERRAADRAGARVVVPGPIAPEELVRVVRTHVGVRGALQRVPDSVLNDADRLAAVAALRPDDSTEQQALDRFTALASELLSVPISTISLLDSDRVHITSQVGLPGLWAGSGESTIEDSFCQFSVTARIPLVIDTAASHPLVKDRTPTTNGTVGSYLGVPIITDDDLAVGSLCAIDPTPRHWTEQEVSVLTGLAGILTDHFNSVRRRPGRHAAV